MLIFPWFFDGCFARRGLRRDSGGGPWCPRSTPLPPGPPLGFPKGPLGHPGGPSWASSGTFWDLLGLPWDLVGFSWGSPGTAPGTTSGHGVGTRVLPSAPGPSLGPLRSRVDPLGAPGGILHEKNDNPCEIVPDEKHRLSFFHQEISGIACHP